MKKEPTQTSPLMQTHYIDITGLQIFANHGVLEQEKRIGNRFEVSLRLYYDAAQAMTSDNIDHALNYAAVVEAVERCMKLHSDLLENVANRIISALKAQFPQIERGSITITKPHPPISTPMQSVSFTTEF